ncbi:IS21 family transposase [Limnochorda pilosa]|uniref:Integrase catalytic subunit n=1 Tax=Limnochorda pilosa TaxID=1555112 RepID=A0A0K2SNM1_LIMPI|nr:IS21 family transposase [Limnochorda pilosa]BAS28728.1 integrase catalytic subunit [Limnochorda pilosa]
MVQQEYIRFLYFQEHRSIREISRMTGHHRKTIRRYLQAPHEKREGPIEPTYPVLGPYRETIDRWLEGDRQVHPKQRHTARRIYQRLRDEHQYKGGESTVREYVRKRKRLMDPQEVYLPLAFSRAESMQVDWGMVTVKVQGEACQVWMFCARLSYSTDIFVRLYPHSRMEAFLDGLRRAFEHFDGVPAEVLFDNLRTAVKAFVGMSGREETEAFLAFRTYYVFRARFCNPRKGNEKGLVEKLVGYARRNFLVPIPEALSAEPEGLEALNASLLEACVANRRRTRAGESRTVGELYQEEGAELVALPEHPYDCAFRRPARVDSSSRVRFETNAYSVPWPYAQRKVELKAYVDRIAVVADGRVIAEHPRSYGRNGQFLKLDHYLEVLRRKPGALRHFRGWRENDLPGRYELLLKTMLGQGRKAKEFIDVLILRRDHESPETVDQAVETVLQRHCAHYEAIRQLVFPGMTDEPAPSLVSVPDGLRAHRVQPSDPSVYRQLAGVGV